MEKLRLEEQLEFGFMKEIKEGEKRKEDEREAKLVAVGLAGYLVLMGVIGFVSNYSQFADMFRNYFDR